MPTRVQFDVHAAPNPAARRLSWHRGLSWPNGLSWKHLAAWTRCAAVRWRERRMLATLDDRLLRDIGISRSQALAEAAKPCWRR